MRALRPTRRNSPPNSVAQVGFLGDSNGSSNVAFTCQNVYLWVTQVGMTSTATTLAEDISVGPVTMKAGANVDLKIELDMFIVTFTGDIVDSGSAYVLGAMHIGRFLTSSS